jgi:hypothetical protein
MRWDTLRRTCVFVAGAICGNALHDLQIPPNVKTQVWCNGSHRIFVESVLVPPDHVK